MTRRIIPDPKKKAAPCGAAFQTRFATLLERAEVQADEEATAVGVEVGIDGRAQDVALFRVEQIHHAGAQRQVVTDVVAHREVVTDEVAGVQLVVQTRVGVVDEVAGTDNVRGRLPVRRPVDVPGVVRTPG